MEFAERFNQVIKDRGIPQTELARKLGIPYETMRYKAKKLSAWKVTEWNTMVATLRLTDEEVTFLTSEVN